MGHARKWASVALSGLVAASLFWTTPGPARAAEEVLDWRVGGEIEAGGMISYGKRNSSKFNEYRDMDNGFIGEFSLKGEKKDSPYYFDLKALNPARDDQSYEGALGRYGLFKLDLGWDRTPHVLSNSGATIFQESNGVFTLPPTLRAAIRTILTTVPVTAPANFNAIASTINGLLRPVDLSFNTDVARAGFKLTPSDAWRFDLEYSNLRREGHRPVGTVIGSPGGSATELAIPIENYTHEAKFGVEYARPTWGFQFNYTGSIFDNHYDAFTWDNPLVITDTATASKSGQFAAAPDNFAHTLSLTGTSTLPLHSRISGTFAYSMLRQDAAFVPNTLNPVLTIRSTDDSGNSSPDAQANLVLGNVVFTSRPIKQVSVSARYRYFEYQNDTPDHVFSFSYPEGVGPAQVHNNAHERFTKQNAGGDVTWRPISALALKAGLDYEHWNRGDREVQSSDEYTGKFSVDVTPIDWFLGRATYSHGERYANDYQNVPAQIPQLVKFDEGDRRRDRVDVLFQLSPWETVTPSVSFGYARDDFHNSSYGLKSSDYITGGASLGWSPETWLQLSGDYSYERYFNKQQSRNRTPTLDVPGNDWESTSKDEFHNLGVNATIDIVPKKFSITLGDMVTFGYTTIRARNLTNPPTTPSTTVPPAPVNNATALNYDKIYNILLTGKVVATYNVTEKLRARLGYAYERYLERDFARDPMQAFMGGTDFSTGGIQSVFLGATQPNYEAHIISFLLKYAF